MFGHRVLLVNEANSFESTGSRFVTQTINGFISTQLALSGVRCRHLLIRKFGVVAFTGGSRMPAMLPAQSRFSLAALSTLGCLLLLASCGQAERPPMGLGDFNVFMGDLSLHRVTPVVGNRRRVVGLFCYDRQRGQVFDQAYIDELQQSMRR